MSCTIRVKTELVDRNILHVACERLRKEGVAIIELPGERHKLFAGTDTGVGIKLPGWQYPIVVKENGTVAFDHYHEKWGKEILLDQLVQAYSVEKARAVLAEQDSSYIFNEERLEDGTLQLVATVY